MQQFSYDELSTLNFTNGTDLSNYLCDAAERIGFKLCRYDSSNSPRIRYYCSHQQIHKNVINTKKAGCPFHIVFNKNVQGIYKLSQNSVFDHSHPLTIKSKTIDDNIKEDVINMKNIGVPNFQIILYVEKNIISQSIKMILGNYTTTKKRKKIHPKLNFYINTWKIKANAMF